MAAVEKLHERVTGIDLITGMNTGQQEPTNSLRLLSDRRNRSLLMSLNAAFWYGAWAFYANHAHGWKQATQASLTQAAVSLTVTFLVTMIIELVSQRFQNATVAILLSAGSAIAFVAAYSVTFHLLMRTPEVLTTIAPVLALGSIYCISYAIGLRMLKQRDLAAKSS